MTITDQLVAWELSRRNPFTITTSSTAIPHTVQSSCAAQAKGQGMGDKPQYKTGDLLSVKMVADYLEVSEDWVRKLIRRDNLLKAKLLGARYIIRWEDLQEYMKHNEI